MPTARGTDWREDFGIRGRKPPSFFTSKDELGQSIPQAHLLRRAFELLELDGVFCVDHSPVVYFKQVERVTSDLVYKLHRQFWNHGGAPVLVLISDDDVHVYSGMTRPAKADGDAIKIPSFVETLRRVEPSVREFITAIESGEFFRKHQRSFDPTHRVDRDLLENLSATKDALSAANRRVPGYVLDALLCRIVFTCYLFDRDVIGETYLRSVRIQGKSHLRDVLSMQPRREARAALYRLFKELGDDFNGDLFSDDLDAESELILDQHIKTLDDFFHGTSVQTGQGTFWPYDFRVIPIETISAIYESFLKKEGDAKTGAFYTPRFLAEAVLDVALRGSTSLLGQRFLDPACGSGIFLVGLFNRIAEEWKQANPTARNAKKAKELMRLLRDSLFGVDISKIACRITAFSLYLAYLDQLSPRAIQELQEKGRALPRLVVPEDRAASEAGCGNIQCADFFDEAVTFPADMSVVIGNPPWGSTADEDSHAGRWCAAHEKLIPDNQIAVAFTWKAVEHVTKGGKACFVLPHGVLFNHSGTSVLFQRAWARRHTIDLVLNLADFQRFLFEKAGHPAVVVSYRECPPANLAHRIEYWSPKADWTVTRAEIITIAPQDRTRLSVGDLLHDLDGPDAPQIWKQRSWATPRDWRLLDRLSSCPRLRDHTRGPKERSETKRWLMGVGFQPVGKGDDPAEARRLELPSKRFIPASSSAVDLFILPRDCAEFETASVVVRSGSNRNVIPFMAPHVLVAEGYTSVAFADFDVSFQHALRGIHGPATDRELLVFLAAYLRTPVARYYLFHTSSNWGVSRQKVHVEEVLRLPFPLPDQQPDAKRCWQIVREVGRIVTEASNSANTDLVDRAGIVRAASATIESLVEEYFDVVPMEKYLIEDTDKIIIPSARPTRARPLVPTVMPSTHSQRMTYCEQVCRMLSGWGKRGKFAVCGQAYGSDAVGVGMVVLEKVERAELAAPMSDLNFDMLQALDRLRRGISKKLAALDLVRGLMVFDRNRLYVVKPIGQRHWTKTAAMNDADEIAGTILMRPPEEDV